jgi:hypothetical protein
MELVDDLNGSLGFHVHDLVEHWKLDCVFANHSYWPTS